MPYLHHGSTTDLPKAVPSSDPDEADEEEVAVAEAVTLPGSYALE